MGNEELGAIGVWTRVCHGKYTWFIMAQAAVKLVFELVTGSTHASSGRIATLGHEVIDDTVEDGVIIKAFVSQEYEIVYCVGHFAGE